jgi:hypothetical protein
MGGGPPPPIGLNPPQPPTPSNDPISSLGSPPVISSASQQASSRSFQVPVGPFQVPPASGPSRTARQSPSPSPYNQGPETPRPLRTRGSSRASSPSDTPVVSTGVSPSASRQTTPAGTSWEDPFVGGSGLPPAMDTDSADPDLDYDGWRKPALVPVELELHALWLREMGSRSGARSLPEEYKVRIAEAVAEVMTAAAEAGVATWGDGRAVAYAHSLLLSPGAPGGGSSSRTDQGPPKGKARASGPVLQRGPQPKGSRPLPRPPVGRGGSSGRGGRGPPLCSTILLGLVHRCLRRLLVSPGVAPRLSRGLSGWPRPSLSSPLRVSLKCRSMTAPLVPRRLSLRLLSTAPPAGGSFSPLTPCRSV